MTQQRVLVTGLGGPSGKAASRALVERGFTVFGADMLAIQPEPGLAGMFVVPAARHPTFVDSLDALLEKHRISWLFPTVQEELPAVAAVAPQWRDRGITVFIPSENTTRICDDKLLTMQALSSAGITVPAFLPASASSTDVRLLGLPVISKPRIGRGGRGVTLHHTPPPTGVRDSDLWQVFMPGPDYDVLTVLDPRDGTTILAQQVFEKIELEHGEIGNATKVAAAVASDVAALATATVLALGLSGPSDIDIRKDLDGKPYVLEINARIGAHTLSAPAIFDTLVQLYKEGCRG